MTKTKRTLLSFVLAICMLAVAALFTACGGNEQKPSTPTDEGKAYSVKVLCDTDTPAVGVKVTIKASGVEYGSKVTGDNGVASFSLAVGNYDVAIDEDTLPDHYELDDTAVLALTEAKPDLTVTLVRKFAYEVRLVKPDGSAATDLDGVTVGICKDGNCLSPVAVEGNVAFIEADKDDYTVQILNLPENLAYPTDDHGYYAGGTLSATVTSIDVPLYDVVSLTGKTLMTAAEKTTFASVNASYNETEQKRDAIMTEKVSLAPNEKKDYVITAPVGGMYKLFKNNNSNIMYFYSDRFTVENDKTLYSSLTMKANEKWYIRVENRGTAATEAQFVLTVPAANTVEVDRVNAQNKATAELTISKEGASATIKLNVKSPAAYKVTVKGETLANIKYSLSSNDNEFAAPDASATFVKGASDTRKFTSAPTTAYYTVSVKDVASYPVKLNVEIEKLNDIANTTNVITVKETLVKQTVPENKELVYIPTDGSAQLVYNNTDKFYHLGTEDGAIVMVNITGTVPASRLDFDGLALAYLDMNAMAKIKYVFDVTSEDDIADLTKGTTYDDYRLFIRGFKDYKSDGRELTIPTTLENQNCYVNFVNDDGVYPLTKELEAFIKLIVTNESLLWAFPMEVEEANFWLYPLCYYDDIVAADPIAGTYTATSDNVDYVLEINKRNTFIIRKADDTEAYDEGTWSKTGINYTFICTLSENATLSITNDVLKYLNEDVGMDLEFMPVVTPDPDDSAIGTYKDATQEYTMTVGDNGMFELAIPGGRGEIIISGTWANNNGTYTFTSSASDTEVTYADGTFTVTMQPADPTAQPTVVTLTKVAEEE
ncbi:MAG: hypothetical protein OSJ83_05835 [Clostridia bacterium]|nr:hypothetical protein [Clostridia bacterium]